MKQSIFKRSALILSAVCMLCLTLLGGCASSDELQDGYYASQLLEAQSPEDIDALAGATSSYNSFLELSAAVIEQAKLGDSTLVVVDAG